MLTLGVIAMSRIMGSVGRGGQNRRDDVMTVQRLLNEKLSFPLRPLDIDGICGSKTIFAIEEFQRRGVKMMRPDGRVDPSGATFRTLTNSGFAPQPPKPPKPEGRWLVAWSQIHSTSERGRYPDDDAYRGSGRRYAVEGLDRAHQ
jgi:hypothetical protein